MATHHPTPRELREWKRRLDAGQASTGMLDRVIEGYEALWRVMRAARPVIVPINHSWETCRGHCLQHRLDDALAPFADLEPEQMELEP